MTNDEIIFLSEKVKEWRSQNLLKIDEFCDKNEINRVKFKNFKYLYDFSRNNDREFIEKINSIDKDVLEGASISKSCIKYGISRSVYAMYKLHHKYHEIIKNHKKEYKEQKNKMNFVHVSKTKEHKEIIKDSAEVDNSKECELIEKLNDIEIFISKGIKVIVSPNIETVKIIKIIELLKEI